MTAANPCRGWWSRKDYFQRDGTEADGRAHGFEDSDFGARAGEVDSWDTSFGSGKFDGDRQIVGKTVRISRLGRPADGDRRDGAGSAILAVAGRGEGAELQRQRDGGFLGAGSSPNPKYLKAPHWNVVARLRDGATPQQGQAGTGRAGGKRGAGGARIRRVHAASCEPLTEEMNRDGRRILLPLLGAAALVLADRVRERGGAAAGARTAEAAGICGAQRAGHGPYGAFSGRC